jgi:hypothetical protein
MDLTGFNALEIEPATSYEPLPADWYKVVITDTEEKPTKAQTGSYLQLTIEVIEGNHAGRKVFDRLNLKLTLTALLCRLPKAACPAFAVLSV